MSLTRKINDCLTRKDENNTLRRSSLIVGIGIPISVGLQTIGYTMMPYYKHIGVGTVIFGEGIAIAGFIKILYDYGSMAPKK